MQPNSKVKQHSACSEETNIWRSFFFLRRRFFGIQRKSIWKHFRAMFWGDIFKLQTKGNKDGEVDQTFFVLYFSDFQLRFVFFHFFPNLEANDVRFLLIS